MRAVVPLVNAGSFMIPALPRVRKFMAKPHPPSPRVDRGVPVSADTSFRMVSAVPVPVHALAARLALMMPANRLHLLCLHLRAKRGLDRVLHRKFRALGKLQVRPGELQFKPLREVALAGVAV